MGVSIEDLSMAPEGLGLLDALLFPLSARSVILPRLASPAVGFVGQLPAEQVWPAAQRPPGVEQVPVVGLMLHVRDPSVARDLDTILGRLHMVASLSEFDFKRMFFGLHQAEDGTRYQTADFGQALTRRISDPTFAPLLKLPTTAGLSRLTYGIVGDWYLICSQEVFFRECLKLQKQMDSNVNQSAVVQRFVYHPASHPLLCAFTRADALSALLQSVDAYWNHAQGQLRQPNREATLNDRPLQWVAQTLRQRQSIHMQLWRTEKGFVRGTLRIAPPE